MNLGRQWDSRLKIWDEAFEENIYRPLGTLDMEGFTTMDFLSLEAAKKGTSAPFPPAPNGERNGNTDGSAPRSASRRRRQGGGSCSIWALRRKCSCMWTGRKPVPSIRPTPL